MARIFQRRFPAFGVFLLIVGLVWFIEELGYLAVDVPWIPIIVIVFAISIIYNRLVE